MTQATIGSQPGLTHEALLYASDDEFTAAVVPVVNEGLGADHAVIAAVSPTNTSLLRETLGADAAEVTFLDAQDWYRRPALTIAGWQRLLDEKSAQGYEYLRIIGEVVFGPTGRHASWARYEAAVNDVFADAPAWLLCLYDVRTLPDAVLERARLTHPLVADPVRRPSADYLDPALLLGRIAEPLTDVSGPPHVEMAVPGHATIAVARATVRTATASLGWLTDRREDFLLALTELVSNGLRHGSGRRWLRLWVADHAVVVEVTDEGPGPIDPLVGYRRPSVVTEGGWGLWLAHHVCDAVTVESRDATTIVRCAMTAQP